MSSTEAAVSYASLILADADIEITSDKLLALTKAAGLTVDPVWTKVFAEATEGQNLKELLFAFGAAAPSGGAAAPAAAGGDAAAAPAEEEAAEESESDEDMGMGLFD